MTKIKITEAQFRKLVREEGEKIKKEIILKTMLSKIDSELNELNEVHAGGDMAPGKDGVHAGQKKPVFTKKGTHLVEDQDDDMDMGVEVGDDSGAEVPQGETLDKSAVMAAIQDLGNKLELDGVIEFAGEESNEMGDETGEVEMGDEAGAEDAEVSMDVDVENGADDAEGSEEAGEENAEEVEQECDTTMQETDETPAEQRSVVSESPEQINENADPKKKKLNEEVNRWKFLAGIK